MGHRVTGLSAERARGSVGLVGGWPWLAYGSSGPRTGLLQFVQTKRYALKMNVTSGWPKGKQSTRMYKLVHYFFFTSLN